MAADLLLRSFELQRSIHWWRYPDTNGRFTLKIPICWLLSLLLSPLLNSVLLLSTPCLLPVSGNPLISGGFALVHVLAATGLCINLPLLLLPCLAFYIVFSICSFLFLVHLLPRMAMYTDDETSLDSLHFQLAIVLPPLLPLNCWTSKSICEAFLLLRNVRSSRGKIEIAVQIKEELGKRTAQNDRVEGPRKMRKQKQVFNGKNAARNLQNLRRMKTDSEYYEEIIERWKIPAILLEDEQIVQEMVDESSCKRSKWRKEQLWLPKIGQSTKCAGEADALIPFVPGKSPVEYGNMDWKES